MYYVYSITNIVNSKVYIGITCDVRRRWYHHLWGLRNNRHTNVKLQRAFNLYGEKNFEFKVLVKSDCSFEDIAELEIEYIAKYDSYRNGYNQSLGGDGTNKVLVSDEVKKKISESLRGNTHALGIKRSDKTKKLMSDAMKNCSDMQERKIRGHLLFTALWSDPNFRDKMYNVHKGNAYNLGKHHSEDVKEKISLSHLGENNPFYGKHHSDATKKELSKISKNRWDNDSLYVELVNKNRNAIMRSDEYRTKQSISSRGRSLKTSEFDALTIRYRYLCGEKPINIHVDFPKLSLSGLKKICYCSSWKHLPNSKEKLYNMLINYQSNQE